jgi:hypothetical protein
MLRMKILGATLVGALTAAGFAGSAETHDVTVVRGGADGAQTSTVSTHSSGVVVHRGSVGIRPPTAAAPGTSRGAEDLQTFAGEIIWFVDEERGRITACEPNGLDPLDDFEILCESRPLPRATY